MTPGGAFRKGDTLIVATRGDLDVPVGTVGRVEWDGDGLIDISFASLDMSIAGVSDTHPALRLHPRPRVFAEDAARAMKRRPSTRQRPYFPPLAKPESAMSQPQWKLVYATDYSALYRDTTGVYPAELAIAQTLDDIDEDDIEATAAVVYRFPLERCWRVTEDDGSTFLCEQNPARQAELPHPLRSYTPWYAKYLKSIAYSIGRTVEDIVSDLCSDDPMAIARGYEAIGCREGYDNFDSSPQGWTESEFNAWPERGDRLSAEDRSE